ncbi:MAG: phosphate ABC transporter ATP-binding protein [Chloroflexota bacterium]
MMTANANTTINTKTATKIDVQNISFTYEDGTQALKDISLEINSNEIFVLFGPARSGKSTLLRLLNRLSDLTSNTTYQGKILFNGQDIFARDVDVTTLRRQISMVFALPSPLPGSIRDNLTYGLKMAGLKDRHIFQERIERSLKQAGLWNEVKDRLDTSAFALSGGQQQRLCLARSLALEPEVIVLDNPTSGLDPLSTGVVEESLYELKRRYTIIMVPHSVQQASRIAHRAAFSYTKSAFNAVVHS